MKKNWKSLEDDQILEFEILGWIAYPLYICPSSYAFHDSKNRAENFTLGLERPDERECAEGVA
jgi:hypothetical protein